MTDKQILDCEYLIKINEMRTCKALNVSFYGDIICRDHNFRSDYHFRLPDFPAICLYNHLYKGQVR